LHKNGWLVLVGGRRQRYTCRQCGRLNLGPLLPHLKEEEVGGLEESKDGYSLAGRFDGIELGVHCAKCGLPIYRGNTPYKMIGGKYYHSWCMPKECKEVKVD